MDIDISALASLPDEAAAAAGISPKFLDVIKTYAAKGVTASKLGQKAIDIVKDGITEAEKAKKVALACTEGAAIGACIPLLGEIGVGEVLGAICAGIYSAFDNFGPEIAALFNPPDFTEGHYDAMRRAALKAGAVPNPGHAPDNEDGCIFPDGTTSGGDYPRHPPAGVQAIRGDAPYTAETAPVDAADVLYDQTARETQLGLIGGFFKGLKRIDFYQAGINEKLAKKGATGAQRTKYINHIVDMYAQLYATSAPDPSTPVNLVDFRANAERFVRHPPAITHADILADARNLRSLHIGKIAAPPLVDTRTLPAFHMTIIAAKNGDADAQKVIAATVAAASDPAAPQATVQSANAMTFALKLQKRSAYVTYWLYGEGAKRLAPSAA